MSYKTHLDELEAEAIYIIREVAAQKPVFGTCAGLILLARDVENDAPHIGAMNITVARNSFGRQIDSFITDLDVQGTTVSGEITVLVKNISTMKMKNGDRCQKISVRDVDGMEMTFMKFGFKKSHAAFKF